MGRRLAGHGDWSAAAYKRGIKAAVRNPQGIKFRPHGKIQMAREMARAKLPPPVKPKVPSAQVFKKVWVEGIGFKRFQVWNPK